MKSLLLMSVLLGISTASHAAATQPTLAAPAPTAPAPAHWWQGNADWHPRTEVPRAVWPR